MMKCTTASISIMNVCYQTQMTVDGGSVILCSIDSSSTFAKNLERKATGTSMALTISIIRDKKSTFSNDVSKYYENS